VVDEQIVVSPLQVEVCGESFLLVEEFLPLVPFQILFKKLNE